MLKDVLYIHQNAEIDLGVFLRGNQVTRKLSFPNNGFYLFVLDGGINVADQSYARTNENLSERDAIGIWNADEIRIDVITDSKIILIEMPMR